MSGGGSRKGRKLAQYRRSNFWPRPVDEARIDSKFAVWPFHGTPEWANSRGFRQNVAPRIHHQVQANG